MDSNVKERNIYAVVPAAGRSSRMDSATNKQFLKVRGIPVLARTLMTFDRSHLIDGIVVVCGASETEMVRDLCSRYVISKLLLIVDGGPTRQHSVRNALEALEGFIGNDKAGSAYVLIHDGARPFLSDRVLSECVEALSSAEACICAVPVKDTIKRSDTDGFVDETIPRDRLWSVQTPQGFFLKDILEMHRKAAELPEVFTDDASVAEYFGVKVKIVNGDYTNIKITTRDDLILGEAITRNDIK